ncbi:MAG: hypothetical protein E7012_05080 [Alphaproteobacteria bacterium]|nr:hypothetical protein [Alphaproteobacteria bacterium]
MNKILNYQEQEEVLRAVWLKYSGGSEYRIILNLLDKGYTLTSTTVALLCVNQPNSKWFAENCHHFKHFTTDAVKVLKKEVDVKGLWEYCVDDIRHNDGKSNYKLAYALYPEKTLEHLKDRAKWEEIFSFGNMAAILYLQNYAPKSFLKEKNFNGV